MSTPSDAAVAGAPPHASLERCTFCRGGPLRHSSRFSSPAWSVVQCDACSVRYVDPMPDPATLARYYRYEDYGRPAYDRGDAPTEIRTSELRHLLEMAGSHGLPRGRLLDVGCSTGQMLVAARRCGWDPEGIEIDERTAAVAEAKTGSRVRVGRGLEALDANERFEAITMSHWLEHHTEPRRQLELAREHLVPGGAVLVRVPNAGGDAAQLLGWGWRWFSPPVHLFYFTESSLRRVAADIGLEVPWALGRQGDAYALPVELGWGYTRRLYPWSRARRPAEAALPTTTGPTHSLLLAEVAEKLSSISPLRGWEDSELVMLLRRPGSPTT